MHPTLLKLGPLHLKAYGLMLAISFILGIYFACYRARKRDVDCQDIMDLAVWILVAAIAGSRFYYVITHWNEFSGNLLSIVNPFQNGELVGIAGLSMQGGVILAIIVAIGYMKYRKYDVWKVADIYAPSFMLGMAITRVGCHLNGCCWGKACDLPWGVVFPPESAAGWVMRGIALHPTQLYSSLAGAALFGLILFAERFKKFDGYTFWLTMGVYSLFRFGIDFVRYYETQMKVFQIGSVTIINNQIISLIGVAIAIGFGVYLKRRASGEEVLNKDTE